jgi:hypothetical protein
MGYRHKSPTRNSKITAKTPPTLPSGLHTRFHIEVTTVLKLRIYEIPYVTENASDRKQTHLLIRSISTFLMRLI